MTSRGRLWTTLARGVAPALLVLALGASDVAAQRQRGPGPRTGDRAELEQRVRARFAEVMKERLGLTAEQAEALGRTVDSFRENRRQLFTDEQDVRRRMQEMLMNSDPSDEEGLELLRRMEELREEEARLFQAEQRALLEVLTPVQVVRFHAMREQLSQRIQELRGGGGPPRGPRPGGPGGPGGSGGPGGPGGPGGSGGLEGQGTPPADGFLLEELLRPER